MHEIKNCKILVTGGAGFIGSTLVNRLSKENEIIVVDDLSTGKKGNLHHSMNVSLFDKSVTDYKFMNSLLTDNDFDYIFHLAAIVSVSASIDDPKRTHEVNLESCLNILEQIKLTQKKLKRFIFSSSASVYGNACENPQNEKTFVQPLSPYAIDKYASEQWAIMYNTLFGIPTSCARLFNVYGPNQKYELSYSGFISKTVDHLKKDEKIIIFGDGEQVRDFVYVLDVIEALIVIATSNEALGRVFNVGTEQGVNLNQIICLFERITKKKIEVEYRSKRRGDIMTSVSNISELRNLGFSPKYKIDKGLKMYLDAIS